MIPISVRSTTYRVFRLPALRRVGDKLYSLGARHCAGLWSQTPGVDEVNLIRGAVKRCVPGVSDLDYLALLNEAPPAQERIRLILELRRRHTAAKIRVPFLGGVQVTDRSFWHWYQEQPWASRRWYEDRRVFYAGQWLGTALNVPNKFSLLSLTSLGLHHLARAQWFAQKAFIEGDEGFYAASTRREASKAIDYAEGNALNLRNRENLSDLLQRAFHAVHALAKKSGPWTPKLAERNRRKQNRELLHPSQPLSEQLRSNLMASATHRPPLKDTAWPFLFELLDPDHALAPVLSQTAVPILLFSAPMVDAYAAAGAWDPPASRWTGFSEITKKKLFGDETFHNHFFDAVRERLAQSLLSFFVPVLSNDRLSFHEQVSAACLHAFCLSERPLEIPALLYRRKITRLPKTCALFELSKESAYFPTTSDSMELLVEAYEEMGRWVRDCED